MLLLRTCPVFGVHYKPLYRHATTAAEEGRWGAVINLIRSIHADCPKYGDPANLLAIHKDTLEFLRERVVPLPGHSGTIHSVSFSPNGELLASAADDDHVKLWMLATRTRLALEIDPLGGNLGGSNPIPVTAISFYHDGRLLVSGSTEKEIKFWDVIKRKELKAVSAHSEAIRCLATSPDGKYLASGSDDRHIILHEMPSGQRLENLTPGYQNIVTALAFSPDSHLLVSASRDGGVTVWNMIEGHQFPGDAGHKIAAYSLQNASVTSLAFAPDGSVLALGSTDSVIRLWRMPTKDDLERNSKSTKLSTVLKDREISRLTGHYQKVNSVAFSPDGSLLVSASSDGTVKFWDATNDFAELRTLEVGDNPVKTLAVSPDGAILATSSKDRIKIWSLA